MYSIFAFRTFYFWEVSLALIIVGHFVDLNQPGICFCQFVDNKAT